MKSTCLALLLASASAACTGKSAGLPAAECVAWQDFYDATGGPGWTNFCSAAQFRADPCSCKSKVGNPCKGGPSSGEKCNMDIDHIRSKVGVTGWQEPDAGVCCENGHITQMAFALNNLNGPMPDSMNDLPMLTDFSACGNNLTSMPKDLSKTDMKWFRLHVNNIVGPIPAAYATTTSLEIVSFSDNRLTGPVLDVSGLPNLTDLWADCNSFDSIPASWNSTKLSGKCFINASPKLLDDEKCSAGYTDNKYKCPLPAGVDASCHGICA